MILKLERLNVLTEDATTKSIVAFGSGQYLHNIITKNHEYDLESKIDYIVDNNPNLWGSKKLFNNKEIEIVSPDYLSKNVDANTIVLVTTIHVEEVCKQLDEIKELKNTEVHLLFYSLNMEKHALTYNLPSLPDNFRVNTTMQIPKKIHYFWCGGNDMPEANRRCVDSFKKICPDYEIIEWNESNYDISKNKYMLQAYKSKKWGFVPDFARLDIIYEHGGIYLDTDVELLKNLDELLYNDAFCGFESDQYAALGLGFGARKGFPLLKEMMADYDHLDFIDGNGQLNLKASPVYQTEFLEKKGLKKDGTFQMIDGMTIYPAEYLNPKSLYVPEMVITENTYSIHHYDGSWLPEGAKDKTDKRNDFILKELAKRKDKL